MSDNGNDYDTVSASPGVDTTVVLCQVDCTAAALQGIIVLPGPCCQIKIVMRGAKKMIGEKNYCARGEHWPPIFEIGVFGAPLSYEFCTVLVETS